VVLIDVSVETLAGARQRLSEDSQSRCLEVRADVLNSDDVAEAVRLAIDRFGSLEVLVNNVGGRGSPAEFISSSAECERELDLCVTSAFVCSRAVIPHMAANGTGVIINVASSAGRYYSDMAGVPYVAGKAGVLALTRAIASEYGAVGIRCNSISPGSTLTEQGRTDWKDLPDTRRDEIQKAIPLGRLAEPTEIADAIFFLCSDSARYITGVALDVNGGQHMS